MQRKLIPVPLLILLLVSGAVADITEIAFDFNPLSRYVSDPQIGAYMTGEYGSLITTDDALVGYTLDYESPFLLTIGTGLVPGWDWDGNFDIYFHDVDIVDGVWFDGWVFVPSSDPDFSLQWYKDGVLLGSYTRNDVWEPFYDQWVGFGADVSVDHLRFSNSGTHSIAIDNLIVRIQQASSHVPTPAAVVLTVVGLGVVATALGWRKRGASQ